MLMELAVKSSLRRSIDDGLQTIALPQESI
jgi:hypothetical protein